MSNVGRFHAELSLNTQPFSEPMRGAIEDSEKLAMAMGGVTVATDVNAVAASRAGVAMDSYAASTGAAAAATLPAMAATAGASKNAGLMATAMDRVSRATGKAVKPLTDTYAGMNRLGLAAKSLTATEVRFNRMAALTNKEFGVMRFVLSRLTPAMTQFQFLLSESSRGARLLHFLSRATITLENAFTGMNRGASRALASISAGAGWIRNNIDNFRLLGRGTGAASGTLARFAANMRASVGPAAAELATVLRVGLVGSLTILSRSTSAVFQPMLTMRNLAFAAAIGLGRFGETYHEVARRATVFRREILAVSLAAKNLSAWMIDLAFAGKNSMTTVGGLGQLLHRWGAGIARLIRVHPQLVANVASFGRATVNAAASAANFAMGSPILVDAASGIARGFRFATGAVFDATAAMRPVAQFLGPKLASGLTKAGQAAAYFGREVVKGVATTVRLGAVIGWVANELRSYIGQAIFATTKTTLLGVAMLHNSGMLGKLAKAFGLAGLAMSGLLGPVASVAAGLAAVGAVVPGIGPMFSKAFGMASKAVGFLAGKIAVLVGSVAALTGGVLAISGAIGTVLVGSQFKAAGAVADASDKLGVQTEALVALRHAGSLAGVETDRMDKSLRRMNLRIHEAKPDSPLSQALANAGLSAAELRAQRPEQQIRTIADAMEGMAGPTERLALATKLFGEEGGPQMVALMSQGSAAFDEAARDADKLGLSMSRVDGGVIEQANTAVFRLKQLFVGVGRQLAVRVAPFVEALAVKLIDVGTAGGNIGDLIDRGLTMAGAAVAWTLDMVDYGITLFQRAQVVVLGFAASAVSGMATVLESSTWLASGIDFVIDGFLRMRIKAVETAASIVDGLYLAIDATKEWVNPYWDMALSAISWVLDGVVTLGKGVIDVFKEIWSWLPSLPEWLGGGEKIPPVAFTQTGASLREMAEKMRAELQDRKSFNFDGMAGAMNKAAGAIEGRVEKLGKHLEETALGKSLGERFKDFTGGIAEDARRRAEETAARVEKGMGLAGDEFAAAADKVEQSLKLPGQAAALVEGSAAEFAAALDKPVAVGSSQAVGSASSFSATTPHQTAMDKGSGDELKLHSRLLTEIRDFLREEHRERQASESVTLAIGTL